MAEAPLAAAETSVVTPAAVRLLARYNTWQNASLMGAAGTLEPAAREVDLGAHFGSIRATLSHLLWADRIWMSRLSDWPGPEGGISESTSHVTSWPLLRAERISADARIEAWAAGLGEDDVAGDLTWWSGAAGREISRPRALCVLHLFNHQTHHRGQVHAMLTAAGARPGDTDLFLMP